MLVSAVVFLVKIYVQCGLVDAVLLLYRFFIRFHKIEPVKDAIGQDEARKELKLCRCVVFHTSKVRSFDTQTYLQVYVYVTLCHGSLQVSRIKIDNASSKFRRQSQKREQKVIRCSVLIVCEGTKTEPNYFEAFAEKQQGVIVYDIEVKGLGRGTKDVVEKAIDLKNKNNYDRVWAVFDRDEFPAKDFNEAIAMGQKNSIEVAWSNEAFELWYLYHFQNVITGVSRKDYEEKISTAVNASPKYKSKKKYRYAKKDPNNYKIMTTYGSMESALRYAEAKHLEYADSRYANQNPCTTIYQLVRQLLGRDEKLNAELIARIGENEL